MHDLARWLMSSRGIQMITLVLFVPPLAVAMTVAIALTSGLNVSLLMSVAAVALRTLVDWLTYGPDTASATLPGRALIMAGALAASIVLARTRSLNLTLQLAVIALAVGIAVFWLLVGDLQAYWMSTAEQVVMVARELAGTESIGNQPPPEDYIGVLAAGATAIASWSYWLVVAVGVVFGHFLWVCHKQVPESERYGAFSAIRASRTIAATTVIAAIASSLLPAAVLINIAIALLLTFIVAGLSLVRWVTRDAPGWILTAVVVVLLLTPLWGLAFIAICIAGYVDAWFNLAPERMPAK